MRKSQVHERLAARLGRGLLLQDRSYPFTAEIAGVTRGSALAEIDLSFQGTVLSVEDCLLVAALVAENDTLVSLRLNSHRPLPVKELRGDAGHVVEILDFSNAHWHAQEVMVAARLLR